MDDVVARARRVELAARRLLEGRLPGRHRSLFRGHGVELAEIRPYQPGDDFRSIDWNVTARTGRPHVKRVEEERELPLLLAVDVSGSLDFGTARRTKRERAAEVAATLALAALRDGHPVGQLLFTDRLEGEYVAPGRGRGRLRRLLTSLVAPTEGRGTDLSGGLDAARLLTGRRSLVAVVTDLVGAGDFGRALDGLARRHDVLVVEVRDPADDRLPGGGLLPVRDPESGQSGYADLASPRVRRRLRDIAAGERARAHAELERRGVDRVTVGTGSAFGKELAALFRRRGGGPAGPEGWGHAGERAQDGPGSSPGGGGSGPCGDPGRVDRADSGYGGRSRLTGRRGGAGREPGGLALRRRPPGRAAPAAERACLP